MKCKENNNLLQDFIDGNLSDADTESVSDHHRICTRCAQQYRDALDIIDALRKLQVPPPSADFSARVIAQATKVEKPQSVNLKALLASGIAASFFIIFSLALLLINPIDDDHGNAVVLIGDQIKTIKVAIDSAEAIDGVKMSINVSDNIQISGYETKKSLSWETRLKSGTNIISLPVSAIALGDGEITTRLRLKGNEKVFKIKTINQSPDQVESDYPNINTV